MAYPLSWQPGRRALDLGADTRLFLWTIAWDLHALASQPLSVFDANIFYPEPRTLAYSEHLLGSALLGAPWMAAAGNPILTLNAVVLLSCIGCGIGAYLLARRLGVGVGGALATGVIFAFAPPRFFRLGQVHLAGVQWIPFCLAFLHAWATRGSLKHLLAAVLFFSLQALSGGQSGLFLMLASIGLVLYLYIQGLLRPRGPVLRDLALAGGVALALNLPFILPYFRVQQDVGLRRSLQEAREWSPNAVSFIAAPTHVQRALLSTLPRSERRALDKARSYLFFGFLTLALAALALSRRAAPVKTSLPGERPSNPKHLVALDTLLVLSAAAAILIQASGGLKLEIGVSTLSARNGGRALLIFLVLSVLRWAVARKKPFSFRAPLRRLGNRMSRELDCRTGVEVGFYLVLAVLSLWASLGPRYGLYAGLYRLVPGFDFIRVPSRLTVLTLLGLAVLAGAGTDRLLDRFHGRLRGLAAAAVLLLLLVEFAAFPLDARPYGFVVPSVDQWLAGQPGAAAVAELPVPDPRDAVASARIHSLYMLYSTAHWRNMVNGYSGFAPPGHSELFRKLVNFPDEAGLDALEEMGVGYAVLHRDLYSGEEWERLGGRLRAFGDRLRLAFEGEDGRVYRLTRSKAPRAGRGR